MSDTIQDLKVVFTGEQRAELQAGTVDNADLSPDEVVGRTVCSLISPGTELNMYLGNYHKLGIAFGTFPCAPGYAAVFAVERVGAAVKDISPGDLAFCTGKHALRQRHARAGVIPLPADLAPERATFARLASIGMSALTLTSARAPENILVTGLGPIGLMAALVFQRAGYLVTGCDVLAERCTVARARGFECVVEGPVSAEPSLVGTQAMVLECSGHEQAVLDACSIVRRGGEVILAGVPLVRRTDLYAQEILNAAFRNWVTLRSGNEWQVPLLPAEMRRNSMVGNMSAAMQWIAEGSMRVEGLYSTASPADIQQVYQEVLNRRTPKLTVALDWGSVGGE